MKGFRLLQEGALVRVVLDHPPVNVLTIGVLEGLAEGLEPLRETPPHAVLLTAEGRAFSAGMDVGEHAPAQAEGMLRAAHRFFRALWSLPCPVVAAAGGAALGGAFEALLLCDAVLASEDARFALPEVTVGAFPPLASVLLPTRLPWPRAFDLVVGGRGLDAHEARAWGLVTAVFPAATFAADVEAWTAALLGRSASVARQAKRAMRLAVGDEPFQRLLAAERQYGDELLTLGDAGEGVAAFLEKRAPRWSHS